MGTVIAVVGAGPAGSAAALTLRRYLPGVEVVLISVPTAGSPQAPGVGESLSPGVLPLLDYLGIRQEFLSLGNLCSWRAASAWGAEQVFEQEYLLTGLGSGWQIDRSGFDSWLLDAAQRAGARCLRARAKRTDFRDGRWWIELNAGGGIEADAIVDATGRAAWLARNRGVAPQRDDGLVAEARWYVHNEFAPGISGTLVEATEDGWWYSSVLPGRRGVAMFMTDSDLRDRGTWEERLALAPETCARLASWHATGEAAVRAANSQSSRLVAGKGWVSAGDAAAAFDPVSSLGIGFSLRSGMEAARVAVAFAEKDDGPAAAYQASVGGIYADYRNRLQRIYRRERRWPQSPFWARRHGNDRCGASEAHGR